MTVHLLDRKGKLYPKPVINGAVELLAALSNVPADSRLDAVAIFVSAACRTCWMTHPPNGSCAWCGPYQPDERDAAL